MVTLYFYNVEQTMMNNIYNFQVEFFPLKGKCRQAKG
ncbi:hypothetical protein BXY64_1964 [Marinifilum flexuosum]|uniref:Uncharacterized protein n=1 Tax=Marinifilum flexuosum TaxID=1117708 RepID=A0A419XAY7_9BACT|nr:hypothetical protein BXY64_1964 [Marinifilum flexuosum]